MLQHFRARVRRLRDETTALYLAARHPETPWYAKLFAVVVVAYAVSPIDLIPDFIPVIGYLDDLVLIPLGIVVAIRMIPPHVLADCRERSRVPDLAPRSTGRIASVVIICIWLAAAALCARWAYAKWGVDR
jgi:uncharacterized membrane protein YkvA (DUF1232 family)